MREININEKEVERIKNQVTRIVETELVSEGARENQELVNGLSDLDGWSMDALKDYVKEEQELMEHFGRGLESLIQHIQEGANDFLELDRRLSKLHIIK